MYHKNNNRNGNRNTRRNIKNNKNEKYIDPANCRSCKRGNCYNQNHALILQLRSRPDS